MILIFIIFVVAVAAVLQWYSGQHGLEGLREDHYSTVHACEPDERFEVVISLENHSRRFLPFIRFQEYFHKGFQVHRDSGREENAYGGVTVSGTVWLRPRQRIEKHIPVSLPRRGRYRLGELAISCGDFLGLHEQRRIYHVVREVVIYPKAVRDVRVEEVLGGFMGDVSARRFIFEDPVLTLGYREYTGREPMKMISWTQSARSGDLMVKNYDHTLEPSVSVLLNVESRSEDQGELAERCFSIARTVCSCLEEKGIKYDFYMNAVVLGGSRSSLYISEGLGQRHFYGILEQLGKAGYDSLFSGESLLERAMRSAGRGHGIVFITPEEDPALERCAARAADSSGALLLTIKAGEVSGC